MVALVLLSSLCAAFAFGPWLSPHSLTSMDTSALNAPPTWSHPFGTDPIGRDILIRALAGGRTTMGTALSVTALTTVVGAVIGAVAGYRGGLVDVVVQQVVDLALVVPALAVLLVASIRFATTPVSVALLLSALLWPTAARLVRAEVLSLKEREFVAGAQAVGASDTRVLLRHLLPHLVGVITVNATILLATAVVLESTLAFLGLGVRPPTPTLGGLVGAGRSHLESNPAVVLAPAGIIVALTMCVHVLGDGIRDAFDPARGRVRGDGQEAAARRR